jgi:tRNA G18 (ribose-2'-O)-methylase SpoU
MFQEARSFFVRVLDWEGAGASLLADYRDLTDSALRRVSEPEEGLYIAESLTILGRALDAGHQPRSVLTSDKWLGQLEVLLAEHGAPDDLPVIIGDDEHLEALTGFHLHRGTLASMHRPSLPSLDSIIEGASRIVVLEDIVDHTNVGALFRSVAGMGADAVIVSPRCADPLYRRSVRVSMGTVLQVPWTRTTSTPELVDALHHHGFVVAGLALGPSSVNFDQWVPSAPERVAMVLGSEGPGLSNKTLGLCDVLVEIPLAHGVDSLNVAAAGAVALHALRAARS